MVPYNRATLFLTYIQGGNMTEWVNQLGDWLELQISPTNPHWVNIYNEDLWDSIILAFNCQFADKLTQEYTLSELKAGIKMKGMDTTPGRTHARLAEAEDFMPEGNRWGQLINNPANQRVWQQGNNNIRGVTCYCCSKKGHMAHSCPQKQQQPRKQHQWQPRPRPSRTCQSEVEENHEQVWAVCDNRTTEQRAQDWLSNIANEQDNIKELIMQQVLGGVGGQDF